MSRGLRQRIEKLEGDRGSQGIPDVIVATCPIRTVTGRCVRKPSSGGWRMAMRTSPSRAARCSTTAAGSGPSQ
jgi:hypothetical protein